MLAWLVAALYGAIQGLTEFLPISSDGHLALAAMAFGDLYALPLGTVVLLHAGTLIATFLVLRQDSVEVLRASFSALASPRSAMTTPAGRTAFTVLVATIPTGIVGLGLHDVVEPLAEIPWVVGACLLLTAALVLSSRWTAPKTTHDEPSLALWPAIFLGAMQGLAVLPGLSRSGTTIAIAMALGLTPSAAFRLSFLLSLPAVLGALILELRHPEVWAAAGLQGVLGACVAFVVGVGALYWVRGWLAQGRFAVFGVYCTALGVGLMVYGLFFAGPTA